MPEGGAAGREFADLVQRIGRGDSAAEEEFARRFTDRIRVMMLVRTRSKQTAEDLAQETLLAALESLRGGHIESPDRLGAFVHGTARNVLNNYFRTHARHPVEVPLPVDLPADPPPERVESAEQRELVRRALARLGQIDRAILRMSLVEGMRPADIAAALRLRDDLVRTRKSRAVKKILGFLEKLSRSPRARPLLGGGKPWTADA